MKEATVVIPNWNGKRWLKDCLTSLQKQSVNCFQVLLVDNGSTDGSADYVREHFPLVQVIAFPRNTGFCRAVNEGIARSTTPYVILLNNDTVCSPGFVEALLASMKDRPERFSGSARMMKMGEKDRIDDAGDYYCALGWAFADGKNLRAGARSRPHRVFAACGGAAIYRREVFDRIGCFDERHFAYLEDIDIGYRARLAGYENWYVPEAEVFHAGSASTGSAYNAFKAGHTARNSIYLIAKNMPPWQIVLNLPLLAAGFVIKIAFYFSRGLGREYLGGLWAGFHLASKWRAEGNKVPKSRQYLRIQLELWGNVLRRLGAGSFTA